MRNVFLIFLFCSVFLEGSILNAQAFDVCPIECDGTPALWDKYWGTYAHNPYMNITQHAPSPCNGQCVWECADFFMKNLECNSQTEFHLQIRKIYTHEHAVGGTGNPQNPAYNCPRNRLNYLNHLKGLLGFLSNNQVPPMSFWNLSGTPTPPWLQNGNNGNFIVYVHQPICWHDYQEEHDCNAAVDLCMHDTKQRILEPCQGNDCPCCIIEYHLSESNNYITVTNVIINGADPEADCPSLDPDCCNSCGQNPWILEVGTIIYQTPNCN